MFQEKLALRTEKGNVFTTEDSYGVWSYYLTEQGKVTPYNGSISGEDIEVEFRMQGEDLDSFEEQLSEIFNTPNLIFSGLSEKERKKQDAWINFMEAIEKGDIIHVHHTSEEFLNYNGKYWYLGTGNWSDWDNEDEVEKGECSYPDGNGGFNQGLCAWQKNKDVLNSVGEYGLDGWGYDSGVIMKKNLV